eukprot:scaffold10999_cov63-Phaeocystis_antarctica.AAC.4
MVEMKRRCSNAAGRLASEIAHGPRLVQPDGKPAPLILSARPEAIRRLADDLAALLLQDAAQAELRDARVDRVGGSLGAHHAERDERDDADGEERARDDREQLPGKAGVWAEEELVPVQGEPSQEEGQQEQHGRDTADVVQLLRGAEKLVEQLSRGLVALGARERLGQRGRAQRGDEPPRRVEQVDVVRDERNHRESVRVGGGWPQEEGKKGAGDAHNKAEVPRSEHDGRPHVAKPAVQERVQVEAAKEHQHVERWVPHRRAIIKRAERELMRRTGTITAFGDTRWVLFKVANAFANSLRLCELRRLAKGDLLATSLVELLALARDALRALALLLQHRREGPRRVGARKLVQEGQQVPEHLAPHLGGQLEPLEAQQAREALGVGKALGLVAALEVDDHPDGDLELARRLPLEGAPVGQVRLVVDQDDHAAARFDPRPQAVLADVLQVVDVAP